MLTLFDSNAHFSGLKAKSAAKWLTIELKSEIGCNEASSASMDTNSNWTPIQSKPRHYVNTTCVNFLVLFPAVGHVDSAAITTQFQFLLLQSTYLYEAYKALRKIFWQEISREHQDSLTEMIKEF